MAASDEVKVHWVDYGDEWDEWIDVSRLRQ